jgi:tRNA A37 threonylcarbamoyladenosine synthetase subunit TsaC/SUA5/YrdC
MPKRQTTGIRVPDNPICLALLKELGSPIISTSVKDDKGDLSSDPYFIEERFGRVVDMVIDGGKLMPEPSSVISLVDDQIEIIRTGKGDVSSFQ